MRDTHRAAGGRRRGLASVFRRRSVQLAATLAVVAFALLLPASGSAVHDLGLFELDGNTAHNSATTPPYDWESIFDASGGTKTISDPHFLLAQFNSDWVTPDTSYFASSNKDIDDVSTWQCKSVNNPTPKDEISNAYAALFQAPSGDMVFYGAAERDKNNGESFVGFWLFKSPVGCSSPGNFTGAHTVGDILVLSNFTGGGTHPLVEVYKWVGGSNPLELLMSGGFCTAAGAGDSVCGEVNSTSFTTPWAPHSSSANPLDQNEFLEVGVDLTKLLAAPDTTPTTACFTRFQAETRSSQETTATLKDYAGGEFATCSSTTVTTPSDANGVALSGVIAPGTIVKDKAVVTGSALAGTAPNPKGTVTFSYCLVTAPAPSTTCSGASTSAGTRTLTGASNPAEVFSDNVTAAAGRYCFTAVYADTSTPPEYVGGSSDSSASECYTVEKQPSTTATTSSPTGGSIVPGTSASDAATVSGGQGQPTPTGTVDFFLCQPATVAANSGDCSTGGTKIGATETLDAAGKATSDASTNTTAIGTYCWRAEYSGDGFYNSSSHTNSTTECFTTAQLTPTVTTVIHAGAGAADAAGAAAIGTALSGSTVHDEATVAGTAGTPTGTVTFTVYLGSTTCSGSGTAAGTVNLSGGIAHPSNDATVPKDGLSYRAHYNGDGIYTVADGPCERLAAITPSIAIVKSPDDKVVRDGDTVTFTIKVTNTGDADLTNVTVTDPLTPSCAKLIGSLAKGADTSYTCTTDALHVSFTNLATVTGTPPLGPDVTASDTAPVTVIHPAITIDKSPDGQSVTSGGTVTFTIKVTNTGDVDLTNVTVVDLLTPSCNKLIGSLLQGASTTYTCTTDALTASFTNLATVTGTPPVGSDVTASDTAPVTVTTPPPPQTHPAIAITKSPPTQTVVQGATVTFTITVTNTGDVTLTDVTVTDALSPGCARTKADIPGLASMAPGATLTYTCTSAAVIASFTNVATATGTPPSGPNVTASASAAVTATAPLTPPKKPVKKPKVVSHKKPKATG
ncbi:MAG: hypothetical protein V7644_38 [Actinomycetota bacterium]